MKQIIEPISIQKLERELNDNTFIRKQTILIHDIVDFKKPT